MTLATYLPMAKRLQKHLSGLGMAQPKTPVDDADVVDGFVVHHEIAGDAGQPAKRDRG